MNIFGVGGPELIIIFIIMMVFVGPKRMVHWSYILGQYVAKFRVIWSQTVDIVQQEFDQAGVDIKIPKEMPTRGNINQTISKALEPVTKPMEESMNEVKKDMDSVKDVTEELKKPLTSAPVMKLSDNPKKSTTPKTSTNDSKLGTPTPEKKSSMGTWSGKNEPATPAAQSNGQVDMGTWSTPSTDK